MMIPEERLSPKSSTGGVAGGPKNLPQLIEKNGRAGEIRTRDLLHPKPIGRKSARGLFSVAYLSTTWLRPIEVCRCCWPWLRWHPHFHLHPRPLALSSTDGVLQREAELCHRRQFLPVTKSDFERRAAEMRARDLARGRPANASLPTPSIFATPKPVTQPAKVYVRDFLRDADIDKLCPRLSLLTAFRFVDDHYVNGRFGFLHAQSELLLHCAVK